MTLNQLNAHLDDSQSVMSFSSINLDDNLMQNQNQLSSSNLSLSMNLINSDDEIEETKSKIEESLIELNDNEENKLLKKIFKDVDEQDKTEKLSNIVLEVYNHFNLEQCAYGIDFLEFLETI